MAARVTRLGFAQWNHRPLAGPYQAVILALRRGFVDRMVAAKLKIPVGMYRGDALLGSMASHDLDAIGTAWDTGRILGVGDAALEISALSAFRWRDIKRQFRREVRQARGRLENAAMKWLIYRGGYPALPSHADDMISGWLGTGQRMPWSFRRKLFGRIALKELRSAPRVHPPDLEPHLVHTAAATRWRPAREVCRPSESGH